MKAPTKPQAGQSVGPFIADSGMWSLLFDMLSAYRNGDLTSDNKGVGGSRTSLIVTSDTAIAAGTLKQIDAIKDPGAQTDPAVLFTLNRKPIFTVKDPVWHTDMDNLLFIQKSMQADTAAAVNRARLVSTPIDIVSTNHRYAMVDPSDPNALKSSTSGIYKIYESYASSSVAILDTQESQPLWMYQLNENSKAPGSTNAKLLGLDLSTFSSSISLSDPLSLMDDQLAGDFGFCWNIGNAFFAIQAPC